MKKWIVVLLIAALMPLTLAACGGKSNSPAAGSTDITVQLSEFMFDPAAVTVPAGKQITLTLFNAGSVEHSWVLLKKGYTYTTPYDADDEANTLQTFVVQAGETKTFTFTSPADPGDYQVVCHVVGHAEAGMVGKLSVVP